MALIKLRFGEFLMNPTTGDYEFKENFDFDPNPRKISKQVKIQWRARHRGRRKLMKSKYRTRETIEYIISGDCGKVFRRKLEFMAKQNAKFRITTSSGNLDDISILRTPDIGDILYSASTDENVFVIIESVNFDLTEGKFPDLEGPNWFTYTLKVKRVNCADIAGYVQETCAST